MAELSSRAATPIAGRLTGGSADDPVSRCIVKASFLISAVASIGYLFGILRHSLTARYFGAGPQTDALAVALTFPELVVFPLISGIYITVVSAFVASRVERDSKDAWQLVGSVVGLLVVILVPLAVVCAALARSIVGLLAPGLNSETLAVSGDLLRLLSPTIVLSVITALLGAAADSFFRFGIGAIGTIGPNVFAVLAIVLLGDWLGVHSVAMGMVLGAGAASCVLLTFAWRLGFVWRPRLSLAVDAIWARRGQFLAALTAIAASRVNVLIDRFLVSGLPEGSIAVLAFGYVPIGAIHTICLVPLATVSYPLLTETSIRGMTWKFSRIAAQGASMIMGVAALLVVIVVFGSFPLSHLLFGGGQFETAAVIATAEAMRLYAVSLLFLGFSSVILRAYYVVGGLGSVTRFALVSVISNLMLDLVLIPIYGINGAAAATSLSAAAGACALWIESARGGALTGMGFWRFATKVCIAAGVAMLWLYGLQRVVPVLFVPSSRVGDIVSLVMIGLASLVAYGVTAHALGMGGIGSGLVRYLTGRTEEGLAGTGAHLRSMWKLWQR